MVMSLTAITAQKRWQKDLKVAEAYYEQHAFKKAITYYQKALQLNKNKLSYDKIAHSYFQLREFKKAVYYWSLMANKYTTSSEDSVQLAKAEFYQGNYRKSSAILNEIKDETLEEKISLLKSSNDSVLTWQKTRTTKKVINLRALNTEASEVAPTKYKDKIVFSSDREGIKFNRSFEQTGSNFFNLYVASKNNKERWKEVVKFDSGINSKNHEGAACFGSGGKDIYFTRSEYTQRENANASDENRLKLYKSSRKLGYWSKPLWFMLNDSLHSFGHPCLSQDENFFFFVADMPTGYGGTDIYLSIKLTDTTWSAPIILGPEVNSKEDELYPFYSEDNTLYFSSDGHPGYGAFDLYSTQYHEGKWEIARNLGPGINSSFDDFSIFLDNKKAYFSSNRPGGAGREDLYYFLIK